MADEIKIKIEGDQKTEAAVRRLGSDLPKAMLAAMRTVTLYLQAYVQKKKLSGDPLKVRSGRLRSSITGIAKIVDSRIVGIVGSKTPYSRIHEFGGEIRPKKGRYLTVPLPAAKTEAGVVRGRARDFKGTFLFRSKAGNLIIMGKPTPGSLEVEPLFILKEVVRIPKRSYFVDSVKENKDRIGQIFKKNLEVLANRSTQ